MRSTARLWWETTWAWLDLSKFVRSSESLRISSLSESPRRMLPLVPLAYYVLYFDAALDIGICTLSISQTRTRDWSPALAHS